jgi:hypothetical protein
MAERNATVVADRLDGVHFDSLVGFARANSFERNPEWLVRDAVSIPQPFVAAVSAIDRRFFWKFGRSVRFAGGAVK